MRRPDRFAETATHDSDTLVDTNLCLDQSQVGQHDHGQIRVRWRIYFDCLRNGLHIAVRLSSSAIMPTCISRTKQRIKPENSSGERGPELARLSASGTVDRLLEGRKDPIMLKKLFFVCVLGLLASAVCARADTIETFTGSQSGKCCFNVTLDQQASGTINVDVVLTDGATFFAKTGNGSNHPGFAMFLTSIAGLGAGNISNLTDGWTIGFGSDNTGNQYGTFDFTGNLNTPGTSGKVSQLSFDLTGVPIGNITQNADGYWFLADIMDKTGQTGESAISSGPDSSSVPEPSSLLLLGSGMLSAAMYIRRRLGAV